MNLVNRVKNIITQPKIEWEVINLESETLQSVIIKYVVPLAAIAAICTFVGYAFIGNSLFGASIAFGLRMAIISFVSQILSVVITSFVVDALAPSFNSDKNIGKSAQLVAYGYTPAFIGAILNIFPAIAFLGSLFGLYGIYLMYLGLGPMKKTPEDKKVLYMIVVFVILIAVYFILGAIFAAVMLRSMYSVTP